MENIVEWGKEYSNFQLMSSVLNATEDVFLKLDDFQKKAIMVAWHEELLQSRDGNPSEQWSLKVPYNDHQVSERLSHVRRGLIIKQMLNEVYFS